MSYAEYVERRVRILEPKVSGCRECRGSGEVRVWDEEAREDTSTICPTCQGSGELWR